MHVSRIENGVIGLNRDDKTRTEVKTIKLKNYKQFEETLKSIEDEELKRKIKASEDYIEYIKIHDEEAYKNYLSYSTYLKI